MTSRVVLNSLTLEPGAPGFMHPKNPQPKTLQPEVAKCLHHGPMETVVGTPSIMAPEVAKVKLGSARGAQHGPSRGSHCYCWCAGSEAEADVVHAAFSWGGQGGMEGDEVEGWLEVRRVSGEFWVWSFGRSWSVVIVVYLGMGIFSTLSM